MKKTLLCALVLLFAMLLSLPANAVNLKTSVRASFGTPVIDGKLDAAYQNSDKIAIANFGNYANSGKESHLAKMATGAAYVLWDKNNLYFYFDVKDPTPTKKTFTTDSTDAVEMRLDFDSLGATATKYSDNTYFIKVASYREAAVKTGLINSPGGDYAKEYKATVVINDTGYVIEMLVPLTKALRGSIKAGYSCGLAISILDDVDDDGKRDLKITWGSNTETPKAIDMLNNPGCCDKLTLVDAPAVTTTAKPAATTAAAKAAAASTAKAAQTSDVALIAAAFMSVASAVIIKKKY